MPAHDTQIGPNARGVAVTLHGDQIARVSTDGTSEPDATRVSCGHARIAPGRVNAHTHIYSGLVPFDMPPPNQTPTSFPEILEYVWWRLDRALDERALRASARYYVADALMRGTTTLIDHHESPSFIEGSLDVIADACDELGMRAVLCFGATERNGGIDEARRGLAECKRFIRTNRRPLIRGIVGLHASFTVSDDTIRDAAAMCDVLDTVMHVHLAEDACDVSDARARGYDGPLERLLALDALPPGSIVAHGVRLTREQVRRVEDAGVWIVQNPRSNKGNGVGYPAALGAHSHVALGTDGYPADLHDEARELLLGAQASGESLDAVRPRVHAAHELASERFDVPFALDTGGAADVVVHAEGEASEASGLVGGAALHVFVAGRHVVADGVLRTGDMDSIRGEAESEAPRLWTRMREVGPTSGA